MKKTISAILFFALAGILAGCHTNIIDGNDLDGGGDGGGDETSLTIPDRSQLDQRIPAESRTCKVTFTAYASWFAEIESEDMLRWITVAPRSSEIFGEQMLTILADENTTGAERTARIVLRCAGQSEIITVNQSPLRSDGTKPEPYEPDSYTDIVSRITVRDLQNQASGAPSSEWRFGFNEQQRRIYLIESIGFFQDREFICEEYNFPDNPVIEHNTFRFDESETSSIVVRRESFEITVNDYGFIRRWSALVFDLESGNPEPIEYQTAFGYADYRLAAAHTGNQQTTYVWNNWNLEQFGMQDEAVEYTYAYNDKRNDRTNIDLNALLISDIYGAAGQFGKRSRNLLVSRTHAKGLQDRFEYTFDTGGRVKTITHSIAEMGNVQPVLLYTVYYANDKNSSK